MGDATAQAAHSTPHAATLPNHLRQRPTKAHALVCKLRGKRGDGIRPRQHHGHMCLVPLRLLPTLQVLPSASGAAPGSSPWRRRVAVHGGGRLHHGSKELSHCRAAWSARQARCPRQQPARRAEVQADVPLRTLRCRPGRRSVQVPHRGVQYRQRHAGGGAHNVPEQVWCQGVTPQPGQRPHQPRCVPERLGLRGAPRHFRERVPALVCRVPHQRRLQGAGLGVSPQHVRHPAQPLQGIRLCGSTSPLEVLVLVLVLRTRRSCVWPAPGG